jgi:hypothetical protein
MRWGVNGKLNQMIQVARTVNNSMNLNQVSTNNVEDKVGFDNQHSVSVPSKFGMPRCASKQRVSLKRTDSHIQFLEIRGRLTWTVLGDKIENLDEIGGCSWKIAKGVLTGHEFGAGALPSSACG